MEIKQEIDLNEAEVKRAIQHYIALKSSGSELRDLDVTIHWRAKHATVRVLKPAPILTDVVSEAL